MAVLSVLLLLAAFNYSNDRWGVYSKDRLHFINDIQTNRFALKTWHVLDNPLLYDCLILGSSRVEMIDTRRFPGSCYNFTHSGGTPRDHLTALRQFTRAGLKFEKVYLGLDEFSYIQDPDVGRIQKMRRPPPGNLLEWASFHAAYLLHFPQYRDWEIFNGHAPSVANEWYVQSPQSSQPRLRQQARRAFSKAKLHERSFETVQATYWGEGDYVVEAVADVSEIVALSKQYGFELTLFFNPLHYTTYLQQDLQRLERFLKGVVRIAPVLDFSGLHKFSLDNRYWMESSHFNTRLADKMIPYLQGTTALALPMGQLLVQDQLEYQLELKYERDIAALLAADRLRGSHLIPLKLAERLMAVASSKVPAQFSEMDKVTRSGDYYIAEEVAARIDIAMPCRGPGRTQLLALDLEFREADEIYLYSPGALGDFSNRRRQRFFVPPGRQNLYVLSRGIACDGSVRISPFTGRGTFRLHEMTRAYLPPP